jgi:basic amino acid/polyamine antiporter, APA family
MKAAGQEAEFRCMHQIDLPGARASIGPAEERDLPGSLGSAVGYAGYFTLAFGAIVGSGWVVVMGDWLKAAGPGGTALGFLTGATAMGLIALCYGELAACSPNAGGEFLYTLETFGPRVGFIVGWFLILYSVAVCAFEAIACAWLLRELFPAINLGPAYKIAGVEVGWDALVIGATGAVAIGGLHYLGARSAVAFQNVITYGFIATVVVLMICGVVRGSPENLKPLLATTSGNSWIGGAFWVFATCAFFLNGWQTALHAIEERRTYVTARGAVITIILAIVASAAFYVGIVIAAASAVPWRTLVGQELPAAAAFRSLGFHGALGTLTLVAATVSLTKTWSAVTWIASRVIYAEARHGLLPPLLATVDPRSGSPGNAILLVVGLTLIGLALGRGAILPIVDMASVSLALSVILCLAVLMRRRRRRTARPTFVVPGGLPTILAALLGALIMVGVALVQPLLSSEGKPPTEWILLAIWASLGFIAMVSTPRLRQLAQANAQEPP